MEYLLGNDAIKVELQMGDCGGTCGGSNAYNFCIQQCKNQEN